MPIAAAVSTELGLSLSAARRIIQLIHLGADAGPRQDQAAAIIARFKPQYFIWVGSRLIPWEPHHEPATSTG